MTPENSLRAVFSEALDRQDAAERTRFLDEACGGDTALRQRVGKLLQAHDEAGGFLSHPSRPPEGTGVGQPLALTEKPGDYVGRYKLLQQIGEGGCGVVYMAEQETPIRRRVALKLIKLGMDTREVLARFEAERQAMALMDHPNIARVLDAGAADSGRPFFVMELVRGVRITRFCDEQKLSTRTRLELFMAVCSAIQHAHQKGVIHRDLKPSNILVTTVDGAPLPRVIDFGIAKATSNQRLTDQTVFTAFDQFIGTPAYMSPEQAEMSGVDIDTRTDIYSLGVVLYELLTGKTPFDAEQFRQAGLDEIRRTIRDKVPLKPSTRLHRLEPAALTTVAEAHETNPAKLIHRLRGDLDWVVMKCLEKDRNRRYETANGLAADVRRHLTGEPVLARPPSAGYRLQKLVRRNKVMFAAATLVLFVLLLATAVSTRQAVRATEATRRAEDELWKSRFAEARALRFSREPGRKSKALEALAQAARLQSSPELVHEAIAHLALFDVDPARKSALPRAVSGRAVFNHRLDQLLTWELNGTVKLRDATTGQELKAWQIPGPSEFTQFSADDRWVHLPHDAQFGTLLNVSDGSVPRRMKGDATFVAFCHDSARYLTVERGGGEAVVRDLVTATPLLRVHPESGKKFTARGAAHPGTNLFAIVEGAAVSLWNWDSGARCGGLEFGEGINALALGGDWLAAAGKKRIHLANLETGQQEEISDHEGTIDRLHFLRGGNLLVSSGWDGKSCIWQPPGTQVLLSKAGLPNNFDRGEGRLGFVSYNDFGWWKVSKPSGRKDLPAPCGAACASFSPDGKLLVAWLWNWIAFYETETGRRLKVTMPREDNQAVLHAQFLDDNRSLVVASPGAVKIWFLERTQDTAGLALKVQGSELVNIPEKPPYRRALPLALTPDGTRIALALRNNAISMEFGFTETPAVGLRQFGFRARAHCSGVVGARSAEGEAAGRGKFYLGASGGEADFGEAQEVGAGVAAELVGG